MSPLWPSVRFLQLYIEEPDGYSDLSSANPIQDPRLSPFTNLHALCLYEDLPTRLVSLILAHTPLLRELEVVPCASPTLEEPSPIELLPPCSRAYPQYPFRLRRLGYFGDDSAFFYHLFAQSRGTITWLALLLHHEPSDEFLGCIEEENQVQRFICLLTDDFRTFGDPSTAYRLLAALPRLRVLMMDHDQLAASPEIFAHCEAPLHRLVITLDEDVAETVDAGIALLVSALCQHVHSVRQLREISLVHDSDYPEPGDSRIVADLRALCTPRRIRVDKQSFEALTYVESFASMLGRLVP